jgi:nitroreductase
MHDICAALQERQMPVPNRAALDFMLNRRSRPARSLVAPVPSREDLAVLLTAASRVPDHGKLEPWRFVVFAKPALQRLAQAAHQLAIARGLDMDVAQKGIAQFADADLVVAVVKRPMPTDRIPETEQVLSAGAVCLTLVNAALAAGWGACWLTGWHVADRGFCRDHLGLAPGEWVAGLIHIGTETGVPPDRPRPDIARITTWVPA